MEEKRRTPRYDGTFEIRYFSPKNASLNYYTISKDISKLGLRMPAADSVREGDLLNLDIALHSSVPKISAIGRVIWTRPIPRPSLLKKEAGIEFVNIKQDDINKLLQTVF